MMHDMKKAKVDDKIIDIIDQKEALSRTTSEDNNYVGVIDDGIIYPLRNASDKRPGFYKRSIMYGRYRRPTETEIDDYKVTDDNIVDFSDKKHIQEVIEAQNRLRNMESTVLTSMDNITIPQPNQNDSPEMIGLKEAIRCKHIDLDKYSQRFGPNYNNDRRLLDKNSITLTKLVTYGNALDMKITLTFEDKEPGVPNPIGKKITVTVTDTSDN